MRVLPAFVFAACLCLVLTDSVRAADEPAEPKPKLNPDLIKMKPNVWFKLHEQKPGDAVRFRRQPHGASCMDTKRGRLVLFGSDTHGRDWTNSPLFFDPVAVAWSRLHADDPVESYQVTEQGIPVAGPDGDRPWAMHTFGSLVYDIARDEMVVACWPGHMVPGRFTNAVKDLWPKIRKHPTWTFDCDRQAWRALDCDPQHFFPNCAVYDPDRKTVLGYRSGGIWELGGEPRTWKQVSKRSFLGGWHNNAAYDAKNKAMVVFGTNTNSNDIEAFWPASGEHKLMPTPGPRPAKDQHNPMAFEPRVGRTVIVVDRKLEPESKDSTVVAETWLYDLSADAWTQIRTATLPFGCGMNYNMEYDPAHGCLLLVTGGYGPAPTTVWALRIELDKPTTDAPPPPAGDAGAGAEADG